ncbi:retrovirus-related pol polyprotein from transposon TNT 1-94, partial [Tanacetum coccineum]
MMVYPPNTPTKLVPRVLPTKSQVKINIYTLTQLFTEFDKTCKKRITPCGLTEGERGFEQTKECYLTEVIPFFKMLKEHFEGIQTALVKELKEMKEIFKQMEAEVEQNAVDKKNAEIERKNLLIENENLIAGCLSNELLYSVMNVVNIVSRFSELQDAYTVGQSHCLELEAEISKLKHKIEKDNHSEMIKRFFNLEIDHLNLQLKYQNLKERFGNNKSQTSQDTPEFDSFFEINKMKEQLQGKNNTIRKLKEQISHMNEKCSEADRTLDFKALHSQNIELTEHVTALQEQNKRFRAENKKVKQHYKELYDSIKITHAKTIKTTTSLLTANEKLKAQLKGKLKCVTMDTVRPKVVALENVETLHKIVEEARIETPLDNALTNACFYTKRSQELLEYVIGTCLKEFSKRDKKVATTPLNRKKQVTFKEPCDTLNNNTQTHVEQQKVQQTDVLVIPSIGVIISTKASGSTPRSNTKKNRILPAKSDNKKKVEAHPRKNKFKLKQKNHVDSSISSKRTWKPTGKKFTLEEQCPLTRFTKSKVVQIVLWYLDSSCSKHMTGNRSRLKNFMKKFIGTVRFENDHFGAIMGYGDYVIGDSVISMVYYVEGLRHNLFSVGQFCDSDVEVAFRKHLCYVRDVDGVELLKGSRGSNMYTIFVEYMMKSSPICLLSKGSKNKSWLWHHRLNHLNFDTINDVARKDLVRGLPRLKFEKDHLCSTCQLGKSKKYTHKSKSKNTIMEVLHTLHMDLCGPMRVQSINGKKYILVIVDDYSRFTWVKFLISKDETLEFVIKFLKQIQVGLNKTVLYIRTDNGTEFVNQVLTEFYESIGISYQKSVPGTPQQNGVVERRNHTLVEAARTMLIFSKALMFLWAKAVASACYTQNRSLFHTRHNKTPYELVHDKKPDLIFLHIFGALCYPINDSEDLGKLKAKANIRIFVGYAPNRKGLVPNPVPAAPYVPPTNKDLEILFQPMFDEYFEPPSVERSVPPALAVQVLVVSAGTPSSTIIDQDASSTSHSSSSSELQPPISHQGIADGPTFKDNPFAQAEDNPFVNVFAPEPSSEASSSGDVSSAESNQVIQPHDHLRKWSKDYPMDNVI